MLALISAASADTIILKNGTRLDGTVLREEGDVYVCSVYVTKNIKDERRIPKAEVSRVDKTDPSLKEYPEIKALLPVPDLMPIAGYQERIDTANGFIKKHPKSVWASDASKVVAALEEELNAIRQGALKFNGKLIKAEERAQDAYEIDAMVLAAKMKQRADSGDTTGALRLFYEMNALQPASKAFKDSLPLAKQVIASYQQEARSLAASFEERQRTRETNLAQLAPEQRARTQAAQAAESAAIAAQNADIKQKKMIWLALDPNDKRVLDEMIRTAENQAKQLDTLIAKNAPADGGEAYRKAWADIHATHEVDKLNEALESARKAGIKGKYLTDLEEAAKAALPPEPKAQPEAQPEQ